MEGIRHAWRVLTFSDVPSSRNDAARNRGGRSSWVSRRHRVPLHRACSQPSSAARRSFRPGAYQVTKSQAPSREHRVAIPEGTAPGSTFTATVGTHTVQAQCPSNTTAGNFVRVMVPGEPITRQTFLKVAPLTTTTTRNNTAPTHDRPPKIKVSIPTHVQPGMTFQANSRGERYSIVCPNKIPRNRRVKVVPLLQEHHGHHMEATNSVSCYTADQVYSGQFAFVRRIVIQHGRDKRLPTGSLSLVPVTATASAPTVTLLNSQGHPWLQRPEDKAEPNGLHDIKNKPLQEKMQWFQSVVGVSCSKVEDPTTTNSRHVKLVIRRDHLVEDSIRAVMSLGTEQLQQPWKIQFVHEPGVDSGGVSREWFQITSKAILSPESGLWVSSPNNQSCLVVNPNSASDCNDHLVQFRFVGRLLGRALLDQHMVMGHLAPYLYKHILGQPLTMQDLAEHDQAYVAALGKLRELLDADDELSQTLCLDFTVTERVAGVSTVVELIPRGADKYVTSNNLGEYYKHILHYRLLEQAKPQIRELVLGFLDVVPQEPLAIFHAKELELTLCGLPRIEVGDWKANTRYSGALAANGPDDKLVQWFWEIVDNFDNEGRARLLQFATGSSGVSTSGFAALKGADGAFKSFAIHGTGAPTNALPRAQTCFNRIDLPSYKTKEDMLSKIELAMELSLVGFGMD
ncbi:Probable E3 ubiquitin-protein ligase hulA [Seminavis robusta]|uniref:HECT-type E3 ubiquitin transferase n=1 Tax=Seminavis robusta TaxID=568900 RepID=A0A9N8HQS1_9STRA|nr:Probable E3 ubiquitin-protein ligase hulA [Seminavis robusta]|eukprot:Sro1476_g275930.1 Probable E3 ubiquitin-protein ligase hulA (683) ;mRNA; r:15472-17697